jgi:heavy metal sensor kinase
MHLRPKHVRTRLTLWYVSVLAGVLILYAAGTSVFLFFNLRSELDRNLRQNFETIESLLEITADGTVRFIGRRHHDTEGYGEEGHFFEIWSPDGRRLYRSGQWRSLSAGGVPKPEDFGAGTQIVSAKLADGTAVRLMQGTERVGSQQVLIRLARSEARLWHELREFVGGLLLGLPVALLIAGLAGYALARRTLAPIDQMVRQAEQIGADHLNQRLPVENPYDELGHLARVFNAMLARLQSSFEQLKRFTSDASHELRTPLTALRSVGEVGLQDTKDASHYREVICSMLEEVDRLTHLVDSLLLLSRADAGHIQLKHERVSLAALAQEAVNLLLVLAEEKDLRVTIEGDEQIRVHADRLLLRQALINLVDSAIKYSPKDATVAIRIYTEERQQAVFEIEDKGPGIAPEHHDKIFQRFYRVDKARAREMGGTGLGLSIVQWAAEVHNGSVEIASEEGRGSVFRLVLPEVS